MAQGFAADVKQWSEKAKANVTQALHASVRELDQEVVERTPVVTGNLRNSREVSTLGPVEINWTTKKFRDPSDTINNAIAGMEQGQTAWLGFRAPYARKIEERHAFLRLAAQHWPAIVDEAARTVTP